MVFCAAWASIEFSERTGPITALWPTNAIVLAVVLRSPSRWQPVYLIVSFLSNYAAHLAVGESFGVWFLPAVDLIEVALAVFLMRLVFGVGTPDISRLRPLLGFLAICGVAAPLLATGGASVLLTASIDAEFWTIFHTWYTADALAILAVAPSLLIINRQEALDLLSPERWRRTVTAAALLLIVAIGVFVQDRFPIGFLIYPPLILNALYLGFSGAALGNLAMVTIAAGFTMTGSGPFASNTLSSTEQVLMLQIFVAVAVLSTLPMVSILSERRRLQAAAEQAGRAKDNFLANMSHELRTPMNAILGFGELMLANQQEPLSPQQSEYVRYILRSGSHLNELIADVLDLASAETGKLQVTIAHVEPWGVLRDACSSLKPTADRRKIEIATDRGIIDPIRVLADRARLYQVLLNLGTNAIKYNHVGGSATMRLEAGSEPGWIRITVSDTGVGIDSTRAKEVFQPFSRLGAEKTAIEGTGIGLSITKHLVELMNGQIGFVSQPGVGSTFWLELPEAPAEATA